MCDGFFFRGREIAGGGRGRLGDGRGALFLTRVWAEEGDACCTGGSFRASKIMLERAMAHPNIELPRQQRWSEEVLGVESTRWKAAAQGR